ncbi:helix-turn-helix transcriptional regulator [Janthinobacterium sp. SUN206]|uniref:helix-turn-helix transcriptional regulator n=1 Tax=Janthinobacterium sp. SUN206 TaxID=3014787 RepID=UPI002713AE8D|nr:helix-turn-helix transcriptional regulator [Janthinobacterium sp. SUN206]MDO8067690.1 helix-turn-helix transcriptional regulator [Janthinobacterium sp. SUN206]
MEDKMEAVALSELRIAHGTIEARRAQTLRRVPVFQSALCRVRQGVKLLEWGARQARAGTHDVVLMPAGQELGVANLPGTQGYRAEVLSFSPALIARFRARHGSLVDGQLRQAATASLCVPLDDHAALAWDQLMASLAAGSPPALLAHQAEGLLLALALGGHCGPLLLDPAADWSVAKVASQLHLGASTLRRQLALEQRHFRAILEDVRLGLALQELQSGILPIGDIAAACGYASPSRFAARFRQHYGLSPRDLRATL